MNQPSETLKTLLETEQKNEEHIEKLYQTLPLEIQRIIQENIFEMKGEHRTKMSQMCSELLNTFNRKCNYYYCAHPLVIECINDWFVYKKFFYSRFCFSDTDELWLYANFWSETVEERAIIMEDIRQENEKLIQQII